MKGSKRSDVQRCNDTYHPQYYDFREPKPMPSRDNTPPRARVPPRVQPKTPDQRLKDPFLQGGTWLCNQPYVRKFATTKDRLKSCVDSRDGGKSAPGYEFIKAKSKQECNNNCYSA